MSQPPPLPAEVVNRVARIGFVDGVLMLSLAGSFALVSLLTRDWLGGTVGSIVAAAGFCEMEGSRLLKRLQARGETWLVLSQLTVLATIAGYAAYQYFCYDARGLAATFDQTFGKIARAQGLEVTRISEALQLTPQAFARELQSAVRFGYAAVALLSIVFQGGMAYYYHRKCAASARLLRKS